MHKPRALVSMSAIGTKRTCRVALHMSAFDPKRTLGAQSARVFLGPSLSRYDVVSRASRVSMRRRDLSGCAAVN